MKSHKMGMRTIDVALRAGCSVQQVRNLERDGVLPPAPRTHSGYRTYTQAHVTAALAYRFLAVGVGPREARKMMRAAHSLPISELLALIDQAHAALHTERRDLDLAQRAVAQIVAEPISELADALGIRPSTLRHWDAEGLVVPDRTPHGRARTYSPTDVRDARIVHQLRQAGYRIGPLQELMPHLRLPRQRTEITVALLARLENITTRSRALLQGSAALQTMITQPASPVADVTDSS